MTQFADDVSLQPSRCRHSFELAEDLLFRFERTATGFQEIHLQMLLYNICRCYYTTSVMGFYDPKITEPRWTMYINKDNQHVDKS